jgi:DNA-directed RNA polymerase specialized sigma24 family protein
MESEKYTFYDLYKLENEFKYEFEHEFENNYEEDFADEQTESVNELLYLTLQGDDDEALLHLHQALRGIWGRVYSQRQLKYYLPFRDWRHESLLILYQSVPRFRTDLKTSFRTLYGEALHNKARDLIRKAYTGKEQSLYRAVPLDYFLLDSAGDGFAYEIEDTSVPGADKSAMFNSVYEYAIEHWSSVLSPVEMKVLKMIGQGVPKAAIAKKLRISRRSVDRTMERARQTAHELTPYIYDVIF